MSSTLLALRASSDANSAEQKRLQEKRRNLLILIHQHLIENGFVEAAERLQHEAGNVISKFEVADNLDLGLILGEYEAYYEMRFDKKPKLVRKLKDGEESSRVGALPGRPPRKQSDSSSSTPGKGSSREKGSSTGSNGKFPTVNGASSSSSSSSSTDDESLGNGMVGLGVNGISVGGSSVDHSAAAVKSRNNQSDASERFDERVLKPPPQFAGDPEMRALAAVISREIYQESPDVRFDDIVELDEAKRLLREAVQLPLQYPALFTGILRPWKGILLHGPPGTGKTLLAKAVATECNTTFFNISASTLVSKWRGDSEKLVRALFEVARYHAPSTIFLDEMDSILTSRGAEGGEHEASRRMKTELLIQMDGVRSTKGSLSEQVFVMAASNLPWDLDVAVLRRLEKRVLVSLPVPAAREAMLRKHLASRAAGDVDYGEVATLTEGYSGADVELLCREAAMMPVRRLVMKLNSLSVPGGGHVNGHGVGGLPEPAPRYGSGAGRTLRAPGSGVVGAAANSNGHNNGSSASTAVSGSAVDVEALMRADPVTAEDLRAALQSTRPSSDGNMDKYVAWQREFGSV